MNTTLHLEIQDLAQLPETARLILQFAGDRKIFLFDAPMGAGKTTLIKEMCRQLGSTDHFSSPTYSIVNEYSSPLGPLYHFDLYRLQSMEELLDIGAEVYLDGTHFCFVEWPEIAQALLDNSHVKIGMHLNENIRYIRAVLT